MPSADNATKIARKMRASLHIPASLNFFSIIQSIGWAHDFQHKP
jgi:hypothetical protein